MNEDCRQPIRVLVVDDSAVARELIVSILSTDPQISVVGEAVNGSEGVEKTRQLKPDIVTMDVEMPVMNGIEAIEHIMADHAVPILVVTSQDDAQTAYIAISRGALDVLPKPDVSQARAAEFIDKVKLISQVKVITHIRGRRGKTLPQQIPSPAPAAIGNNGDKILAIASSTGGPHALSAILSGLPENFSWPIVVAQHIPDGFAHGLADWLKKSTALRLKVAEHGEPLKAGVVYISPSEHHMEVDGRKLIKFVEHVPKDIYHPSCDRLLTSVARVYANRGLGVILTGMGDDGAVGMKEIRKAGGYTIAQNEATSVIYGMNKVAIDSGGIDRVLALDQIGAEVVRVMSA